MHLTQTTGVELVFESYYFFTWAYNQWGKEGDVGSKTTCSRPQQSDKNPHLGIWVRSILLT